MVWDRIMITLLIIYPFLPSGITFDEVRTRLLFYERRVNFVCNREHGIVLHQAFVAAITSTAASGSTQPNQHNSSKGCNNKRNDRGRNNNRNNKSCHNNNTTKLLFTTSNIFQEYAYKSYLL